MRPTLTATSSTVLPLLLARYVAGQITDLVWTQIMSIFDEGDAATRQERTALAAFLCDALDDLGPQALKMPPATEVQDLLLATRLA